MLTESEEQILLFQWAAYAWYFPELKLMHHIPNGGNRNVVTATRLKAEGLKPGVPDICLPVAKKGHHGLYIEMKRAKKSSLSKEQKQWIEDLRQQGYKAEVCKGFEEAKKVIVEYLEG